MGRRALLVAVLLAASALACTTTVPLRYQPVAGYQPPNPPTPLISIGELHNERPEHGSDWLGAIRGGFGNRLKTLRLEQPVVSVVGDAFADGLRARNLYAEPGQGKYVLEGTIVKLDCSEYFNLEAHAHLDLRLLDAATRVEVFSSPFRVDQTEAGLGAGIFGSVETLRVLAERTLRELVDRALDDPGLRKSLQQQQP